MSSNQGGINHGYTMDTISDNLGDKSSKLEKKLMAEMENLDPSDTAAMLRVQHLMSKLSILHGVQSSAVKALKDSAQGIIQRMS